jgi:heptaprenyl diphosphate synthase
MKLELTATPEDHRIAYLATLAIGLSLVDAALPSPLPGVKPGLANIVTLIVLDRYGWRVAAWVSILRVVAGSLLLGTFLAPSFVLSFTGASAALLALGLTRPLSRRWFGPVSHSVVAAFAHVAGQLAVVWLWFIPHAGLGYLVPIFAAAALFFGTVNGLIVAAILERMDASGRVAPATA